MNFIETLEEKTIRLGDTEFQLLHLADFFKLEILRKKLKEDLKIRDKEAFGQTVKDIVFLQTKGRYNPTSFIDNLKSAYIVITSNHIQADAAFLKPHKNEKDVEIPKWNYDGRTLAIWINSFAEKYHWSLRDIMELPINMAVYLYQEIAVSDQLNKEWEYGLTELAYPYNANLKQNEYKPLKRPQWMTGEIDLRVPVILLRKDMLPDGVVVDMSGMGLLSKNEQSFSVPEENWKKEKPNP